MRRGGTVGWALGEVLGWGKSGKGSVRSVVVVEVPEAVDDVVEGGEGVREVVGLVELESPGAVASFDGAVELGSFGGGS